MAVGFIVPPDYLGEFPPTWQPIAAPTVVTARDLEASRAPGRMKPGLGTSRQNYAGMPFIDAGWFGVRFIGGRQYSAGPSSQHRSPLQLLDDATR